MVTLPPDKPVTRPVDGLIEAVAGTLLLHTPPVAASLNVVVRPWQTLVAPVIAAGVGLTVNGVVIKQLVAVLVKLIVNTPAETPVTTPPEDTDAKAVLLLVQVPGPDTSDKVVVEPTHTKLLPVIPDGKAFTVTTSVV